MASPESATASRAPASLTEPWSSSRVRQTVNVLQIAVAAGYPSQLLGNVASQLTKIDGILNLGILTANSGPNLLTLVHIVPARQTIKYPALRLDYNLRENSRFG